MTNLLAPPASGDTMTDVCQFGIDSLMYLRMAGSAYRLSTGMSKKPWKIGIVWKLIFCKYQILSEPDNWLNKNPEKIFFLEIGFFWKI